MKKKLMSVLLVATMIMGLSISASATEINTMDGIGTGTAVTGSATMQLPTIKVTVPTTTAIVINPFQMTYDVNGVTGSSQIVSGLYPITNESNVALAMNVQELTITSTTVDALTAAPTSKDTGKAIYLYMAVGKVNATTETVEQEEVTTYAKDASFPTTYSKTNGCVIVPKYVAEVKEGNKVVVKGVAKAEAPAIYTIPAATYGAKGGTGDDKDDIVCKAPTYAGITFAGAVVANPQKTTNEGAVVEDPWLNTDSVSIGYKITFTPQIITPAPAQNP